MNKKWIVFLITIIGLVVLAACGQDNDASGQENTASEETEETSKEANEEAETRTIEYLGETYTVPSDVERIVITGAMEAMEDAVVMDVEPVGAVTIAGEFPDIYADVMGNAESIGEKQEPNFEKILELQPDVILGSSKFPEEVVGKLEQIATTILVSHISSDWEANLHLMGALSGKEEQADQILADYKTDIETANDSLTEKLSGQKVVAIRIRGGQMFIYPPDIYFNAVLYDELGLEVPGAVEKAETQEAISVEQLAEMNPDYVFMQIQENGSGEGNKAFEELQENPIIQNITAFNDDQVFVNVVDPLLEGGPVYSRILFLEQLQEKLAE
ncbi:MULTISPECIES: ABC transporter substrate-binding protein [Gracilibacillus]|uniref:ABC transporter substrate-binding protein n=1 Tax=Gracilibacillus TaxID=74385 RepID=UPI000824561F|nr:MULTISPECIES: ABC transporter substrate-binding protein [Gracilibacillus]